MGFDLGIDVGKVLGKRRYRNYPTAYEARAAVTRATKKRVSQNKTMKLGAFTAALRHVIPFTTWRIFPMGAVPKPLERELAQYSAYRASPLNKDREGARF